MIIANSITLPFVTSNIDNIFQL